MANIRSAEKDIRRTKTRTARNQAVKGRIRTLRKKVLAALANGDAKTAGAALAEFSSAADKAAKSKVIHKNTAARLKSRVAAKMAKK